VILLSGEVIQTVEKKGKAFASVHCLLAPLSFHGGEKKEKEEGTEKKGGHHRHPTSSLQNGEACA